MAMFSALANDEGYENVFSEQLASLVRSEDIVIAISASGNSQNVIRAVEVARKHGATVVGFTGFDGGALRQLANFNIHVNSNIIEHVEDIHLMLEHLIVKSIKDQIRTADVGTAITKLPVNVFGD
jgi:D-sedoheptulose 7-phosphate isomerase